MRFLLRIIKRHVLILKIVNQEKFEGSSSLFFSMMQMRKSDKASHHISTDYISIDQRDFQGTHQTQAVFERAWSSTGSKQKTSGQMG